MAKKALDNRLATVVDDELADAVAKLAALEQRSESAILRRALQAYQPLIALMPQAEQLTV